MSRKRSRSWSSDSPISPEPGQVPMSDFDDESSDSERSIGRFGPPASPGTDDREDSEPISDITVSPRTPQSLPGLILNQAPGSPYSQSSVSSIDSAISFASSASFQRLEQRLRDAPPMHVGSQLFGFSNIFQNITDFATEATRNAAVSAGDVCTQFARQVANTATSASQYLAVTGSHIVSQAVKNIFEDRTTIPEVIGDFDELVNANQESILTCLNQGQRRKLQYTIYATKKAIETLSKISSEKIESLQMSAQREIIANIERLTQDFTTRVNAAEDPQQVNELFGEFQQELRYNLIQVTNETELAQQGVFPPRQPGGKKTKKNRSCKKLHKCNTKHYCNVCHQPHKCEGHKSNKCSHHIKRGHHKCTTTHYCSSCKKMHKCNCSHKSKLVKGGKNRTRKHSRR